MRSGNLICLYVLIKKENQTFLIYKEIQNGAVANASSNICAFPHILWKPCLIYDFATAPL
jgi:hypothetical protein